MSRLPRVAAALAGLGLFLGGIAVMNPLGRTASADDQPAGPRAGQWSAVQRALDEGKPKTALEALSGLEAAAVAAEAWDEAARAIATRVVAETGDRPPDDPERLVRLEAALARAPERTKPVLEAILANWTWGFFQANRWRFAQRTTGASGGVDEEGKAAEGLAGIASWDLPRIVAEIRRRFDSALDPADRLRGLPVGEWDAILEKGAMPDAYRPTVWDVVAHDCLAFAASGERGLVDPEDTYEFDVDSPALGTREAFMAWKPQDDPAVTDTDSPLLLSARLWHELLAFHAGDADRTALLAADLGRIEWARGAAVSPGGDDERAARAKNALEALVADCGTNDVAALASHSLAMLLRQGAEEDSVVKARAIAAAAAAAHPDSAGGKLCRNLVGEIDAHGLDLFTERVWAGTRPVLRVRYRNLARVHVRIVKAAHDVRLRAGKGQWQWLDDGDRAALLAAKPAKAFAVDLPAAADLRDATHDVPAPVDLPPGPWWVIASADDDFGADDNVVSASMVWVSRLSLVSRLGANPGNADALEGHVVDGVTGLPVAGAKVVLYVRGAAGNPAPFEPGPETVTDADGAYRLAGEPQRELLLRATAEIDGAGHEIVSDPFSVWQQPRDERHERFVLLADRGIHRPGQFVRYKGILARADAEGGNYAALADRTVTVTFRDANGRELARELARTNANGSFHGDFAIPPGALPGQWSIVAEGEGTTAALGVRVEEYKRPKFKATLAAPLANVVLDAPVSLVGTATTYTGLPVSEARVRWRVERLMRFPPWCRWIFPWLPFDGGPQKIARGTATTGADGTFAVTFPARPDRSVPVDSSPVFAYRVVAEVTDPSGETRVAERVVNAGFAPLRASVSADAWNASGADGAPAEVKVTVATESLDGEPRAATGTLTIRRLVQPEKPARPDLLPTFDAPRPRPAAAAPRGPGGRRPAFAQILPSPVDGDEAEGWEAGEAVFTAKDTTDAATGKAVATVRLAPGIYRAEFVVDGDGPEVKGRQTIEVVDPTATAYSVRRGLALLPPGTTALPGSDFKALLGTGHDAGRCFVEVRRDGKVLSRGWTEPGRTQWPVTVPVTESLRGGFTIAAWIVRDGRLWQAQRVIDVPWTDKRLDVSWERFTRRVEPGAKEVWRARVRSVDDPIAGPAAGAAAELVATLYDQSLDALAPHDWPDGLRMLLRRESSPGIVAASNRAEYFQQIFGAWKQDVVAVDVNYRRFRESFGPSSPHFFGFAASGRMRGMMPMAAPMMMADGMSAAGAPARIMTKGTARFAQQGVAEGLALGDTAPPEAPGAAPAAVDAAPPPRKNLVETAFFLPSLESRADGSVTIEFTLPDTLATWQFKALAHDARLRSGTLLDTAVAAKDLMVEPVMPRFLREGDVVEIPVKLGNRSTGRLEGRVRLELADARSGAARQALLETPAEVPFALAAGESKPVTFRVRVADGTEALRWTAIGTAGRASDGEEAILPVLPRRVLVDESLPITLRGPGRRGVTLERLASAADHPSIASRTLVVQATANPAWYAVLALPSIAEKSDESVETLFTRLFANAWAGKIARSDERIARTFALWRENRAGRDPLASPLESNAALFQTTLAETPWLRDAVDETEARRRIGLLFDANRAEAEQRSALARLESLRAADGGWPWFPGGRTCAPVTLGIVADFGRLRAAGVEIDIQPALATLPWLDRTLVEWRKRALESKGEPVADPLVSLALFARSFFMADTPPQEEAAAAHAFWLDVARKTWAKVGERRSQGHLAIALFRAGDREKAAEIVDSLRQRAVDADVKPGEEKDSWQGMWWRDPHPAWWHWAAAPIETQAVLIEAFDEVAGDAERVEAMKAWLLSQKRTSRWRGDRATAAAVGALLGRGADLLAPAGGVEVTVGGAPLPAGKASAPEAGTGFVEARWADGEIGPNQARVAISKTDRGLAWGGVHWQYLDDVANVPAVGRAELAVDKQLFVKRRTKAGAELVPAAADGATRVEPGDELVVRLVVTADRDYEFLELSDHRPSVTEPVDVLSGWRYGDGAAWYLAVRDAATELFFERLPRGTHVFEYSLRAAHRGAASSGFATIRSRYAPEFQARSASVAVEVK